MSTCRIIAIVFGKIAMSDHFVYSLPVERIIERISLKLESSLRLSFGLWATLHSQ